MQSLQTTPVVHAFPQLRRFAFLSPLNQRFIADYLTHLRTRHYALSTQEGALRALKCFAVLMPEDRQAILFQDLTQTTPADIDAWITAAFQQRLAPGTIVTCRRGLQGFFVFLCHQGVLAHSPIQLPRHQILVPTRLPQPMAEAEVVAFFRVVDALQDRTMFLLMLRCGLRVSEVSSLRWTALDRTQGTLRVNNGKGQVDRVVYLSPDVATALRQWHGLQTAAADYVFPSRMRRQRGLPLGARQIRNRMLRSLQRAGITKRYGPHSLRNASTYCYTSLISIDFTQLAIRGCAETGLVWHPIQHFSSLRSIKGLRGTSQCASLPHDLAISCVLDGALVSCYASLNL